MTINNTTTKGMYAKTNFDDDLTKPCEKTSALRGRLRHCFQLKMYASFENDTIRLINSVEVLYVLSTCLLK